MLSKDSTASCSRSACRQVGVQRWHHHTIRHERCHQLGRLIPRAEPDLDWEPEIKRKKGPLVAPPRNSGRPPRQPMGGEAVLQQAGYTFNSRRDILLTLLGGGAAYWLLLNKVMIQMDTKPPRDIPFEMLGAQDLGPEDFVYYKTPGGNWVAVSEDSEGRHFMVDEAGDLYYDTGDPEIGIYVMDRKGDLYNFYLGEDGQRQITPVGNIQDLREIQVDSIGDLKLDRPVKVIGFGDNREVPMPPNAGYYDEAGKFKAPGELLEGFVEEERPWWKRIMEQNPNFDLPRPLVDPADPTPFEGQLMQQVMGGKWDVEVVDTRPPPQP